MRRWQVAKLREAGLDPYMRGTWQEAQAQLEAARREMAECIMPGKIIAVPEIPSPKARGGKPGTCAWCGKAFPQALHFHVKRCPERLKLEAT